MRDKNKRIMLSVIAVLFLILVTIGVTYAVFTYTKLGSTENTVTAGTLKFIYIENEYVGNGISITNAFPVSDAVGKTYSTEGQVFDFSIEATNTSNGTIPYEVTLRKKSTSTLNENAVKVYLTDMTEEADSEILAPILYKKLVQTDIDVGEEIEKTIYNGTVNGNITNYLKKFRLRMWVDENIDLSKDGYSNQSFIGTVNVYSNAKVISEEEVSLRSNTNISNIIVGEETSTKVENKEYDYEVAIQSGITNTTINVETENKNATVEIEKIDSFTNVSSNQTYNVEKLSTSKEVELINGDNYFKITVISENQKETTEYMLKVYRTINCVSDVDYSWNFDYIGAEQEFNTPCSGNYKIELWGASGANNKYGNYNGGNGAYTSGNIYLNKRTSLALYIGEVGTNKSIEKSYGEYGFNGASGGNYVCYSWQNGTRAYNYYGGGATDIRLVGGDWKNFDSLKSRIMVAAGGAAENELQIGSAAGGINGYSGVQGTGATQTSAGGPSYGGFGYAGIPPYDGQTCASNVKTGAGSGYYGGGASNITGVNTGMLSAGSGSSFISGHNGCDAIDESSTSDNIIHTGQANHYSGFVFTETVMIDGLGYSWTDVVGTEVVGQPTHDGTGTQIGNTGNGYAKITYLGN